MNYNYTCSLCRGHKVIPKQVQGIAELCPKCKGKGEMDWVSNATGNNSQEPVDRQLLHMTLMRNIDILRNEIINQGMKAGIRVDVHIEFKQENQFERELMLKPFPSMIKPY